MAKELLDLHGCRGEDVVDRVDRFIVQATNSELAKVSIMTGKGKGIVQKEVIRYLKMGGFDWKYEKDSSGKTNEGVLVVFI